VEVVWRFLCKNKFFGDFRGFSAIFRSKFVGVLDGFGASYLATSGLVSELFLSNFGAGLQFWSNYFGVLYGLKQVLQVQVIVFQQRGKSAIIIVTVRKTS